MSLGSRLIAHLDDPDLRRLARKAGIPDPALDADDVAERRALSKADTSSEVIQVMVDNAWDWEAAQKVIRRAYRKGSISREEYKDLMGESFLDTYSWDT